jgi:hypothetical protein
VTSKNTLLIRRYCEWVCFLPYLLLYSFQISIFNSTPLPASQLSRYRYNHNMWDSEAQGIVPQYRYVPLSSIQDPGTEAGDSQRRTKMISLDSATPKLAEKVERTKLNKILPHPLRLSFTFRAHLVIHHLEAVSRHELYEILLQSLKSINPHISTDLHVCAFLT